MTDITEGDLKVGAVSIHYYRTGGTGPVIVMAHGIADNGLCFSRIANALKADYDMVMVDARGHGQSDVPKEGYSTVDHAADLAGVIERLSLDKPIVIGHSMGAASAALLAANHPELVSSIILEDPPWHLGGAEPTDADKAQMEAFVDFMTKTVKTESLEKIISMGHEFHPGWEEEEYKDWAISKHQCNPLVFGFMSAKGEPWQETVKRITTPALLITADNEKGSIVSSEAADMAVSLNPGLKVRRIKNAGHNIRRDQFADYLLAVKGFLSEIHK